MPDFHSFLLYGATGYTGRLLAHAAKERGLRPILGGRNASLLGGLAMDLGLEHRVASLGTGLEEALHGVGAVLHAAGPFSSTYRPMVEACLRAGVHYLDISGEASTFEGILPYDVEARRRGVMLMPGVGFDVVASDSLAVHVARRLPGARRLRLGISGLELVSRGSFRTVAEGAGRSVLIRRGGVLTGIPPGSRVRDFDYGQGPSPSVAVGWGDVCSAYYSTGIPDIEAYLELTPAVQAMLMAGRWLGGWFQTPEGRALLEFQSRALPAGPAEAQRARRQAILVAEVEDGAGRRAHGRLRTPEAYTFTCAAALSIVERVLARDVEPGFQTPARVYGPDFVLLLPEVSREDG